MLNSFQALKAIRAPLLSIKKRELHFIHDGAPCRENSLIGAQLVLSRELETNRDNMKL